MAVHLGSAVTPGAELRTVHSDNRAMNVHRLAQRRHAQARGFTLIELMIVVAIVAIIAAVALPNYFGSVRKSRRADAITEISKISQAQERWRANAPTYSANLGTGGLLVVPAATAVSTAGTVSSSQYDMSSGFYRLRVSTDSANDASGNPLNRTSYAVLATAIGRQASDAQCATLTMTMTGGTLAYTSTGSAAANQCWNR